MTTTINTINLETLESEVDLNSLFTLTYNFDLLKSVIISLVKSQKATTEKFYEIEEKIKEKERTIDK